MPKDCTDTAKCANPNVGSLSTPKKKKKKSKKASVSLPPHTKQCGETVTCKTDKPRVLCGDDDEMKIEELTPQDAKELDDLARGQQYWMPHGRLPSPQPHTACNLVTNSYDAVEIRLPDSTERITVNLIVPENQDSGLSKVGGKMTKVVADIVVDKAHSRRVQMANALARQTYVDAEYTKLQKTAKMGYQHTPQLGAYRPYDAQLSVARHTANPNTFATPKAVGGLYNNLHLPNSFSHPFYASHPNFAGSRLPPHRFAATTEFPVSPYIQAPVAHPLTDDVIDVFINTTGQSATTAIHCLQTCNGDLHRALALFYHDIKGG